MKHADWTINDGDRDAVIRTSVEALEDYGARVATGGGVTADSLYTIAKHLKNLLPPPKPAPELNARGQEVWPALCHSPNSCTRNCACMYWNCPYPLDRRVTNRVDEDTQRRIDSAHAEYVASRGRP